MEKIKKFVNGDFEEALVSCDNLCFFTSMLKEYNDYTSEEKLAKANKLANSLYDILDDICGDLQLHYELTREEYDEGR